MLKAIELENFKAFGQRTRIDLAPITLIFGQNSAGKTSILQALSLLKQTLECGAPEIPLLAKGELVDLGSFGELLFDHDLSRNLGIRIDIDPDATIHGSNLDEYVSDEVPESVGLALSFSRRELSEDISIPAIDVYWGSLNEPLARLKPWKFGFRIEAISQDPTIWRSMYDLLPQRREAILSLLREYYHTVDRDVFDAVGPDEDPDISPIDRIEEAIEFYSSEFSFEQFLIRGTENGVGVAFETASFLPREEDPETTLPEIAAVNTRWFRYSPRLVNNVPKTVIAVSDVLREVLGAWFPIGPFRPAPRGLYSFRGTKPKDIGVRGDLMPDLLFRRPDIQDRLNAWLQRLEINYSIEVQGIGDPSLDLFQLRLADQRRKKPVSVGLSNVGYGISQILPFIVQCLGDRRRIISIEQPEVHIHPKLQADLGELLAECIGESYRHQFLIETHSEHLILRLQKLIRDRKLAPEAVSVIYVERGPNGSTAHRLRLDEQGDFIDDWPGGFFSERLRELR